MATRAGDGLEEVRWPAFVLIGAFLLMVHGTGVRAQTACVGDCDESGSVRVNELIVGVNIALERAALSVCPSFDASGNQKVEVNELVTGVNNALRGCPPITDPSPTASHTINPQTPTSTATATVLAATATATFTVALGTATPTEAIEEATETPTAMVTVVGTATPTGTVEETPATPTATRTVVAGIFTPTRTVGTSTVTPTLTIGVGTSTPTGSVEEVTVTPTSTIGVGTATPTGAVEEATATPTLTLVVGTATPTGTVDEATATPTLTIVVTTSTPTGTVGDETPTAIATFTMLVGTSTPTGTVGETTPTPTATPTLAASPTTAPAARFAGATTVVVNSLMAIPSLVGAIANGFHLGMGGTVEGGEPATCPGGGFVTKTGHALVEQDLGIVLSNCRVPTRDGFVTYNGRILQSTVYFTVSDGNTMLPGPFTAAFENSMGTPTMTAHVQIAATVNLFQSDFEGPCAVTNLTMEVSDTISMTTSGGTRTSMAFANTEVVIDDITFSDACVPIQYRVALTGDAELSSSVAEPPVDVMFNGFVLNVDDSIEPVTFSISGGFASPCFGGAAAVATQMLLALPDDEICPTAGEITATVTGATTRIVYRPDQSVDLDVKNDGTVDQTFPLCQDQRLYDCPA